MKLAKMKDIRFLEISVDIDVMISGHQHRTEAGKLYDTYYTQTAANGAELDMY